MSINQLFSAAHVSSETWDGASGDESISPARLQYLEGLRGCAALAVVFHHLLLTFLPAAVFHEASLPRTVSAVPDFFLSQVALLWDGPLAIRIFFIHSGLVLSYRFFRKGGVRKDVAASAFGRYLRLTPPLAASIFAAYFLLEMGWMRNGEVAPMTGSEFWLGSTYEMTPSFTSATRQALWESYTTVPFPKLYNTSLWTIKAELRGSFMVYFFLLLFGRMKIRPLLYAIGTWMLWRKDVVGFIIGMALCDVYFSSRIFSLNWRRPAVQLIAATILLAALLWASTVAPPLLDGHSPDSEAALLLRTVKTLSALCVIAALIVCVPGQRFFNWQPIQYLGKLSYSLYLVHAPIICSVGCSAFLYLRKDLELSYLAASLLASLAVVLSSIASAHILWKSVDMPSIGLGRRVGRWAANAIPFWKKRSQPEEATEMV